jgi:hypothetical protein
LPGVDTVADYLRHAAECEELAKLVRSLERREATLQIAEAWRKLAEQRQERIKKDVKTS